MEDPALDAAAKAIEERNKALQAELDASGGTPPPEPTTATPEIPAPDTETETEKGKESAEKPDAEPGTSPEPKQGKEEDIEEYKAKVADLQRRLQERDGKHGTEKQQLQRELDALREEKAALEVARVGGEERASKKDPKQEEEFSAYVERFIEENPDLAEEYDKDSLMPLLRVQYAEHKTQSGLARDLAELKQREMEREHQSFFREVEAVAPGFIEANGTYDVHGNVVKPSNDPGWISFLNTPMSPEPFAETWGAYALRVDTTNAYAAVYKRYQQAKTPAAKTPKETPASEPDTGPSRPSLADQASPRVTGGSGAQKASPVLSEAGYKALMRKCAEPGYVPSTEEKKKLTDYRLSVAYG